MSSAGQYTVSSSLLELNKNNTWQLFSLFQQGIPMPRRNLAKMAAAFYACVELHKIGELDDNLLPVRSLSDDESDSQEEEEGSAGKKRVKAGTKKRKRVYQRKVRTIKG